MSAQGIKSRIQEVKWIGDRSGGTLPKPWRAWARFRGHMGARAPGLRATGHPLAHFLLVPINTPWVLKKGDIQSLELYCCFVCRSCNFLSFLLLLALVLAIRVKERECVQVVFER